MLKKNMFLFLAVLVLLQIPVAQAQMLPGTQDFVKFYELKRTVLGEEVGADAVLKIQEKNKVESFTLRIFADVKDGTTLLVFSSNSTGMHQIGQVQMILGSGSLSLVSSQDPSEAFPLDDLQSVEVRSTNGVLLTRALN